MLFDQLLFLQLIQSYHSVKLKGGNLQGNQSVTRVETWDIVSRLVAVLLLVLDSKGVCYCQMIV